MRARIASTALVLLLAGVFSRGVSAQTSADSGVVKVTSSPAGAYVYSEGKNFGATPLFVELPVGGHQLIISRDGYAPVARDVNIRKDRVSRLSVELDVAPGAAVRVHQFDEGDDDAGPGTVQIVTHPPGLRVFMGDLFVPQPTPVVFDVAAGTYELRLEQDEMTVFRRTVFVRKGRTLDLELQVRRRRKIDDQDPWK